MNDMVKTNNTGIQSLGSGHSVLGEVQARIPVGGKIRSGIMVLKNSMSDPKAIDIYNRGVAAGASWAAIDHRIKQALNQDKACLIPKAVEHFGVKRSDFTMPDLADKIIEMHGEDRGDGRKVYRFPIVLAFDNWQANMPHGLKSFTASEIRFWSDYAPDGTRYCKSRAQVKVDSKAKRAMKTFGGRPEIINGQCEPNNCREYQSGACKLSGSLIFFIPGIPGSSAIELPTTSFYAMQQWRQQMELVSFMRGGKLSGLINDKPIFWLTKHEDKVSMIDPATGKPQKRKAWIVHLEADIPMDAVFRSVDRYQLPSAEAAEALGFDGDDPGYSDVPEYIDGEGERGAS